MESRAFGEADLASDVEHRSRSDAPSLSPPSPDSQRREPATTETIVVKIGGSLSAGQAGTLGEYDTALADLVTLQRRGVRPIVVHGGGKTITEWMARQGVRPRFVRGLRVTDAAGLDIVVAVLTGLVNKSLVGSIIAAGGQAVGVSGVDGGILRAEVLDPELGLVGRVVGVGVEPIRALVQAGCIPVIAPVALRSEGGGMLNVNADTAAGEIAAAMRAERLFILTDVEGVLDSSRRVILRLTEDQAKTMARSRIVAGGMVPKLEACMSALGQVAQTHIIDGRRPRVLLDSMDGKATGTRVG